MLTDNFLEEVATKRNRGLQTILFGVSSVLMVVFVQILGISEYLAPILRLVFTIPLNFVMNKLWAFKEKFK